MNHLRPVLLGPEEDKRQSPVLASSVAFDPGDPEQIREKLFERSVCRRMVSSQMRDKNVPST